MICAPSEDSDQPGHQPSLIRVFAVRMKKAWVLSYPLRAQRRLRSDWVDAPDWVDAQADLSLRWAHMPLCWFCHDAAHLAFASGKVFLLFVFSFFKQCRLKNVTCFVKLMSHAMRTPVYDICEQQRHRSACAFAQSIQHLCCSIPR